MKIELSKLINDKTYFERYLNTLKEVYIHLKRGITC